MGTNNVLFGIILHILFGFFAIIRCSSFDQEANQTAKLFINASPATARKLPDHLFGIFFEEINHAGAGGLWAELVNNRGFESGGQHSPSSISPWSIIGDESSVSVSTDLSSCFKRNQVALRMEVLCDSKGSGNACPDGGVGISNPGFWGMNIEEGKTYKLVLYIRSDDSINVTVQFSDLKGSKNLGSANIIDSDVSKWTRKELLLKAQESDHNSTLQLKSNKKGVVWFDQVSVMPSDTYKGHGFRSDLYKMVADLKPGFLRYPGGCFVQGSWLRNAFRWKETVGPWEERPGHFGDIWNYWTDDGLGHFEFLQLAEDLGALPIWVFNSGNSLNDQVEPQYVLPFVQEALDGIEFARGDPNSTWGSIRAEMGHPEPFDLRYVAIGNEDCNHLYYHENYRKFYDAIRRDYPDIKMITTCDGSSKPLNQPADMYDFHIYGSAKNLFSSTSHFDNTSRHGPKAFVSEYAVTRPDSGKGSLYGALAEAAFLIGIEKNSDIVEMASYAPLFVNDNDWRWIPDAIVFNSWEHYGTPSYWMQHFFINSNGATLHNATLQADSSTSVVASAITFKNSSDNMTYLRLKIVNFGSKKVNLKISIDGFDLNLKEKFAAKLTTLSSKNLMDENSFKEPNKISPVQSVIENAGKKMEVMLIPHSFSSIDLLTESNSRQ